MSVKCSVLCASGTACVSCFMITKKSTRNIQFKLNIFFSSVTIRVMCSFSRTKFHDKIRFDDVMFSVGINNLWSYTNTRQFVVLCAIGADFTWYRHQSPPIHFFCTNDANYFIYTVSFTWMLFWYRGQSLVILIIPVVIL